MNEELRTLVRAEKSWRELTFWIKLSHTIGKRLKNHTDYIFFLEYCQAASKYLLTYFLYFPLIIDYTRMKVYNVDPSLDQAPYDARLFETNLPLVLVEHFQSWFRHRDDGRLFLIDFLVLDFLETCRFLLNLQKLHQVLLRANDPDDDFSLSSCVKEGIYGILSMFISCQIDPDDPPYDPDDPNYVFNVEGHHVVPKGVGGALYSVWNMIYVSCADHFFLHMALDAVFFDHGFVLAQACTYMSYGPKSHHKWNRDTAEQFMRERNVPESLVQRIGKARAAAHAASSDRQSMLDPEERAKLVWLCEMYSGPERQKWASITSQFDHEFSVDYFMAHYNRLKVTGIICRFRGRFDPPLDLRDDTRFQGKEPWTGLDHLLMGPPIIIEPRPLAMANDSFVLPPLACFAGRNLEVFTVETPFYKQNFGKIKRGRVGFRCCHCLRTVFSKSIKSMTSTFQCFSNQHFKVCKKLPSDLKSEYERLLADPGRVRHFSSGDTPTYWSETAKGLGMVDTDDGIRFGVDNTHLTVLMRDSNSAADTESAVFKLLVRPEDRSYATDFWFQLFSQVRVVGFRELDAQPRKGQANPIGFPGFACIHCYKKKSPASRFFYSETTFKRTPPMFVTSLLEHLLHCAVFKSEPGLLDSLLEAQKYHSAQLADNQAMGVTAISFFRRLWKNMGGPESLQDAPKSSGGSLAPVPVEKLDPKTGKVLAKYPSVAAAGRACGAPRGSVNICSVLAGKLKTAFRFMWRRAMTSLDTEGNDILPAPCEKNSNRKLSTVASVESPLDTKMPPLDTKMPPMDTKMPPLDTKMPPVATTSSINLPSIVTVDPGDVPLVAKMPVITSSVAAEPNALTHLMSNEQKRSIEAKIKSTIDKRKSASRSTQNPGVPTQAKRHKNVLETASLLTNKDGTATKSLKQQTLCFPNKTVTPTSHIAD